MGFFMTITPLRLQFKKTCELFDISREKLRHLQRTDETFPKAIKMGESKQSAVYFDYAELMAWHESQKKKVMEQEVLG